MLVDKQGVAEGLRNGGTFHSPSYTQTIFMQKVSCLKNDLLDIFFYPDVAS